MKHVTTQYDLFRLLSSEMKGELTDEFYSSFVRNIIRRSENSEEFESTSDILMKLKKAIDSVRDNLITELTNQGSQLPDRTFNNPTLLHPNLDDLLDVKEVVKRFKISRQTLYSWREKGLVHTQVGGRVFFKISDIHNFIENQSNNK